MCVSPAGSLVTKAAGVTRIALNYKKKNATNEAFFCLIELHSHNIPQQISSKTNSLTFITFPLLFSSTLVFKPPSPLLYFISSAGETVSRSKQLLCATTHRYPSLSVVSRALRPLKPPSPRCRSPQPSDLPRSYFLTSHPTPVKRHADFISPYSWDQLTVVPLSLYRCISPLAHPSWW